jgi:hypothetical protein
MPDRYSAEREQAQAYGQWSGWRLTEPFPLPSVAPELFQHAYYYSHCGRPIAVAVHIPDSQLDDARAFAQLLGLTMLQPRFKSWHEGCRLVTFTWKPERPRTRKSQWLR